MNLMKLKGHGSMLGANVMWGLMSPMAKFVMVGGAVTPLVVTDLRITGAMVLFWISSFLLLWRYGTFLPCTAFRFWSSFCSSCSNYTLARYVSERKRTCDFCFGFVCDTESLFVFEESYGDKYYEIIFAFPSDKSRDGTCLLCVEKECW